jgi:orotidine-5'-phosphate decarboxylase
MARPAHFGDAVIQRCRALGHPLCAGLDPHLPLIPPLFRAGSMEPSDPRSADAVEAFLFAAVERFAGRVALVKPQSAFFEVLGWRGARVLERLLARCRELDLLVLLDAKRGDIGSTAEGYAQAYLAPHAPLRADALTLNPYLGRDTLEPYLKQATQHGVGAFVLVKTSNPGSGDVQDRVSAGAPVWEHVASGLADAAQALLGPETGWSSLGIVVGATYPEQAERARLLLPRALQLVPGYGAQGASAADAVRGFVAGPRGREGGVVNSSRALLFPKDGSTGNAARWESALDGALRAASDDLGSAVSR